MKQKVVVPTWSINGGFVVVTYMRPTKDVTQSVTKDVTKDGAKDGKLDE